MRWEIDTIPFFWRCWNCNCTQRIALLLGTEEELLLLTSTSLLFLSAHQITDYYKNQFISPNGGSGITSFFFFEEYYYSIRLGSLGPKSKVDNVLHGRGLLFPPPFYYFHFHFLTWEYFQFTLNKYVLSNTFNYLNNIFNFFSFIHYMKSDKDIKNNNKFPTKF